jgi:psiF repeat
MKVAISVALLSLVIGAGSVFAQTPSTTPAPAAQPAAPAAAPVTGAATDKKAISKACSQQADAQNLKGKARKKFRSACKKNGGKAPS